MQEQLVYVRLFIHYLYTYEYVDDMEKWITYQKLLPEGEQSGSETLSIEHHINMYAIGHTLAWNNFNRTPSRRSYSSSARNATVWKKPVYSMPALCWDQLSRERRLDRRDADCMIWGLIDETQLVPAPGRGDCTREARDRNGLGGNQILFSSSFRSSSSSSSSSLKWLFSGAEGWEDDVGRSGRTPRPSLAGLGAARRGTVLAVAMGFGGCGGRGLDS